jgi:hypothetical protein
VDNFITDAEVVDLLKIAEKGMNYASKTAKLGGPTIMDINSGFVKCPNALNNMYDPDGDMQQQGKKKKKKKKNNNKKNKSTPPAQFTAKEYELYKSLMERIRLEIVRNFGLSDLHFTAPTFITRTVGSEAWEPQAMHDEYWHPHVDKNNTDHYDYSGLLYLKDQGTDFDGGLFSFLDGDHSYTQEAPCYDEDLKSAGAPHSCKEYAAAGYCSMELSKGTIADTCPKSCKTCPKDKPKEKKDESGSWFGSIFGSNDKGAEGVKDSGALSKATFHTVQPAKGRLVMFSSGRENLHQVQQVEKGTRYAMSMWFTCNPERKFEQFLDGKAHATFVAADAKQDKDEL